MLHKQNNESSTCQQVEWNWLLDEITVYWKSQRTAKPENNEQLAGTGDGNLHLFCWCVLAALAFLTGYWVVTTFPDTDNRIWMTVEALLMGCLLTMLSHVLRFYKIMGWLLKQLRTPLLNVGGWLSDSFGLDSELANNRRRFMHDEYFRIQETEKFLLNYRIPLLRNEIERITGEISAKVKNKRDVLNNHHKQLQQMWTRDSFLNETHKERVEMAMQENRRQLEELTESPELKALLSETELKMKADQDVAAELSNLAKRHQDYTTDAQIIDQYLTDGYVPLIGLTNDLFAEQIAKLEAVNLDLDKSNAVGKALVADSKQLGSGESPVTKLLDQNTAIDLG